MRKRPALRSHVRDAVNKTVSEPQAAQASFITLSPSVIQRRYPKAGWRGTRNWRLSLSPIASMFSRLVKTESCDDFITLR